MILRDLLSKDEAHLLRSVRLFNANADTDPLIEKSEKVWTELQVIISKAEDETGNKLFTEGDRASLRREIPLSVLLELMTKMQELGEEATPDAVKS